MANFNQRLALVALCLLCFQCGGNYTQQVVDYRSQKDRDFQGQDSPFSEKARAQFVGLSYYEPNTDYQVVAQVEEFPVGQYTTVQLTNGASEQYQKFGWAVFSLAGQEYRLLLLKRQRERNQLFVAFSDLTNGSETYGGGRYLDVPYTSMGKLVLDFNYAYNPFCAYSPDYVCPVPPADNFLEVEIKAGEKNYEGKH